MSPPTGSQHANITRGTCKQLGDLYAVIQTYQVDGRFDTADTAVGAPSTYEGFEPFSLADLESGDFVVLVVDTVKVNAGDEAPLTVLRVESGFAIGTYRVDACGQIPGGSS